MTESFLEARELYYRTNQFEPGRKSLVFIHGLSGSSSAWAAYEDHFQGSYNILSFDLRGHGRSAKPAQYRDYEIGQFVGDLKALIDLLRIDSCIVIGHSFGAAVALEFLLRYPSLVNAAIFLSPDFYTGGIRSSGLVFPLIKIGAGIAQFLPMFNQAGGHQVDYERYKNTGDWNMRRMAADIPNTGFRPYIYSLKQLYGFDRETDLKDVSVPTLIIHGTKDSLVPYGNSIEAAHKIPNCKLALVQGSDHILILNNFPEVSRSIESFLQTI